MTSQLCLVHHGIKGQRWGVRRFQKRDGSLTTAGKTRYSSDISKQSDASSNDNKEKKPMLTDKQKKALIIGASVAGVCLLAYGTHRYHDVLNDRTMKALAAEGKVIAEDPANRMHVFGRNTPNQALISTKQIALNERVRAYERSKDPVKVVADIITKQDYLKEHRVARDVSRGRTSIWDDSKPYGTDYQFRLYNVGENPGNNPAFEPYQFDPTITVRDIIRGVKKSKR